MKKFLIPLLFLSTIFLIAAKGDPVPTDADIAEGYKLTQELDAQTVKIDLVVPEIQRARIGCELNEAGAKEKLKSAIDHTRQLIADYKTLCLQVATLAAKYPESKEMRETLEATYDTLQTYLQTEKDLPELAAKYGLN